VVTAGSVLYFVTFALAMLYVDVALVGRRRWPAGRKGPRLGGH